GKRACDRACSPVFAPKGTQSDSEMENILSMLSGSGVGIGAATRGCSVGLAGCAGGVCAEAGGGGAAGCSWAANIEHVITYNDTHNDTGQILPISFTIPSFPSARETARTSQPSV